MLQKRHGDHWLPIAQLEDATVAARGAQNLMALRTAVNRGLRQARGQVRPQAAEDLPRRGADLPCRCANLPEGAGVAVGLGFDVLLADLASDGLLASNTVLGQADPLHRHRLRGDNRPFRVQGDLVLFLRDLRP